MNRWRMIERKSGVEVQAEQQELLEAARARGAPEAVFTGNGMNGTTRITVPTEDDPSPGARRLAEALAVLTDPDAEAPPSTIWEDHSPDARRAKWLGDVEDTLDRQGITTPEWARLLEAFGRVGRTQGWLGEDGQQELQALLRTRLGSAGVGGRA